MSVDRYVRRIGTDLNSREPVGTFAKLMISAWEYNHTQDNETVALQDLKGDATWWYSQYTELMPEGFTPELELTESEELSELINKTTPTFINPCKEFAPPLPGHLCDLSAVKFVLDPPAISEIINDNGNGLRFNAGKLRLDLIPPEAEEALAEVLTYGANKYADRNWEKGMKMLPITASLRRHLLKWLKGENKDDESGLSHLKHVLANAAFLVTMEERMPEMDDRPCKVNG